MINHTAFHQPRPSCCIQLSLCIVARFLYVGAQELLSHGGEFEYLFLFVLQYHTASLIQITHQRFLHHPMQLAHKHQLLILLLLFL